MIVRVAKTTGNYTVVDNRPAQDERLSAPATGFLFYLLTKPDDWCVLVDDLRTRFKMGRDATRNVLRELESTGYAKLVTIRDSSGKVSGREWMVQEIPTGDEPNDRKPDFQAVGHRSPENTESLKHRRSVFSGHILSTDRLLNTDVIQNTDVSVIASEPKIELVEAETLEAPPVAAAPPRKKRTTGGDTLFRTHYAGAEGWEKFRAAFAGTTYEEQDVNFQFYYNAVLNWSDSKGAMRKDWIATARTFMLGDIAKNKLITNQPTNQSTNYDKGANNTSNRGRNTGLDIDQSRRVAEAFAAKYSK